MTFYVLVGICPQTSLALVYHHLSNSLGCQYGNSTLILRFRIGKHRLSLSYFDNTTISISQVCNDIAVPWYWLLWCHKLMTSHSKMKDCLMNMEYSLSYLGNGELLG